MKSTLEQCAKERKRTKRKEKYTSKEEKKQSKKNEINIRTMCEGKKKDEKERKGNGKQEQTKIIKQTIQIISDQEQYKTIANECKRKISKTRQQ